MAPSALDRGQDSLAFLARLAKSSAEMPGMVALSVSALREIAKPPPDAGPTVTAAVASSFRWRTVFGQKGRKLHRETASMRRSKQFFWIGASATAFVFKAGFEIVRQIFQCAALRVERAFAVLECTFPDCRCFSIHGKLLCLG